MFYPGMNLHGIPKRMADIPRNHIAFFIICQSLNTARFIRHPVAGYQIFSFRMINPLFSHAGSVHNQLHNRGIGTDLQINHLPRVKVPIRKNMNHRSRFYIGPFCLEKIKRILWKACCIQLSEITVLRLVGRGFSDIIKPGPQKLPQGICCIPVITDTSFIARSTPAGNTVAQGRTLLILLRQNTLCFREVINSSACKQGSRLTSINHPFGMLLMMFFIKIFRIIIPYQIKHCPACPGMFPLHKIRPKGNRCMMLRIMYFHFFDKIFRDFLSMLTFHSVRNFIADTPHDDAGMVPIPPDPACHICLIPFLEEPAIIKWCL